MLLILVWSIRINDMYMSVMKNIQYVRYPEAHTVGEKPIKILEPRPSKNINSDKILYLISFIRIHMLYIITAQRIKKSISGTVLKE